MEAAAQKEKSDNEACDKAYNTVSTRVLRTGYHVIKESLSRESFEKLIVMQHINGLNVGDLCHSGSQMSRFRDAFACVMLDSVARHVQDSVCVLDSRQSHDERSHSRHHWSHHPCAWDASR